jgi:hypothetical protein
LWLWLLALLLLLLLITHYNHRLAFLQVRWCSLQYILKALEKVIYICTVIL